MADAATWTNIACVPTYSARPSQREHLAHPVMCPKWFARGARKPRTNQFRKWQVNPVFVCAPGIPDDILSSKMGIRMRGPLKSKRAECAVTNRRRIPIENLSLSRNSVSL